MILFGFEEGPRLEVQLIYEGKFLGNFLDSS